MLKLSKDNQGAPGGNYERGRRLGMERAVIDRLGEKDSPAFLLRFTKTGKTKLLKNSRRKILIASYLPRHLRKFLPVIKRLSEDTSLDTKLLLLTREEWTMAEESHIPFLEFDRYTYKRRTREFDLAWALEPLIRAIDEESPDLFICPEVNFIFRNAVRYCREKKIKTLVWQHGTPTKHSLHAFLPFEGDCFAAWGEFTRNVLVKGGMDEGKIQVTGYPPLDKLAETQAKAGRVRMELGLDSSKSLVVFTVQNPGGAGNRPSRRELKEAVAEVCLAVRKYPDRELIYQVHPGQEPLEVEDILRENGLRARVMKYGDTEALMAASELVITFFSTTAIDALAMDKNLLLINISDEEDFLPFVKMGAAFGAYRREEIGMRIEEIFSGFSPGDDKRRGALEYVAYKKDGQNTQRAVELIKRCLLQI